MYAAYIMKRTQIYLTEEQDTLLHRRQKATGVTISEQIRAAIDEKYLPKSARTLEDRLRAVEESAGAWKDRTETGEAYVERMRSGRRLQDVLERSR